MLRTLYHRIIALSASPHAPWWLAAVSFAESSFFPIPPDALLIPMVAARPQRAWVLATICTAASLAGALLGYAIGATLYDQVALPIIQFYHADAAAASVLESIRQNGTTIILIKGLIFVIPFKLVTIACGAAGLPLYKFVVACAITRSARFFLVAGVLRRYGTPMIAIIERRLTLVTVGSLALVVLGFFAVKLL